MSRTLLHALFFIALPFMVYGVFAYTPAGKLFGQLNLFDLKNTASVFFETVTPESLKTRYESGTFRILIVPGHDPLHSGAVFNGVPEETMTLLVAKKIASFLKQDPAFDVRVARDFDTRDYSQFLSDYFENNREDINAFITERKTNFQLLQEEGRIEQHTNIEHNFAPSETAFRLYGINRWANEHSIDLIMHIHFNDYPGHGREDGKYTGFAIYVPDEQYGNARASTALAEALKETLSYTFSPSDYPKENGGIVESQELIALGSNATQVSASLLLEYGYIYEPEFQEKDIQDTAFTELALLTYYGIQDYFNGHRKADGYIYDTAILPHAFTDTLSKGNRGLDVFALQKALQYAGVYPPHQSSVEECPINGVFGSCVERSISVFQEKYREAILSPENLSVGNGVFGERTRRTLQTVLHK